MATRVYKLDALDGKSGEISIPFRHHNIHQLQFRLTYSVTLSDEAWKQWQADTWQKLRQAAEQQHYLLMQQKRDLRERLAQQLAEQDTLSLRRAEGHIQVKERLAVLRGADSVEFYLSFI